MISQNSQSGNQNKNKKRSKITIEKNKNFHKKTKKKFENEQKKIGFEKIGINGYLGNCFYHNISFCK